MVNARECYCEEVNYIKNTKSRTKTTTTYILVIVKTFLCLVKMVLNKGINHGHNINCKKVVIYKGILGLV